MVNKIITQITSSVSKTANKEDNFTKLVGNFGLWQMLVIAPVPLIKLSSGWVQMAILFLTPNFKFKCADFSTNTTTTVVENSTCYRDCVRYEYDTFPFGNTIVSEWDLVCTRAWLASFTQTMLQLGILIGSIVFGFLSDRCGRKNTFLTSVILLIAFGFGIPFSPNYTIFTILRFLQGVATSGTMVVSFVMIVEAVGPQYRVILGCLYQIPFVIGHMSLSLFAYYYRDWNTYSLALAVPTLIYIGFLFIVNESPRWLVSVGRLEEAKKIVKRAAKWNKLPTDKIDETIAIIHKDIKSKTGEKKNYSDLLRPSLRVITASLGFMWLVTGVTFFGFNQYISQTSQNPFVSVAVAGAIQIHGDLSVIWLIKYFGRKKTVACSFGLAGLCIITLGLVPNQFWITLLLGTLGVSFSGIVATSIYIYTSELYPTVVRNMGIGLNSMTMRGGSMIAPFISNFNLTIPWLPTAVFGLAPLVAAFVTLLLPETNGRTLPDKIEEDCEIKENNRQTEKICPEKAEQISPIK